MNEKTRVYNLLILDESGSMEAIKSWILAAFNELIQTMEWEAKKEAPEQFIQFFTFNGTGVRERIPLQKVTEVPRLSDQNYHPTASTPLFDAIGRATANLRHVLLNEKNYSVLVTILTDGEENASREFNGRDVRQIIASLEEQDWVFTFMGANQSLEKITEQTGIRNVYKFDATKDSIASTMNFYELKRSSYMKKVRRNEKNLKDDFFKD